MPGARGKYGLSTRETKFAGSIGGGDHGPSAEAGLVAALAPLAALVDMLSPDEPQPPNATAVAMTASTAGVWMLEVLNVITRR
ncbi:MAG TPA: hypothetical protein VKC63_03265 [Solirubrobacterales bacterium]|nr:hypothetical protein [Solirubrobacterales bacterium]